MNRFTHRKQATPPETGSARPSAQDRLRNVLFDAIERLPYVPQLRLFWQDLQNEREWWPILLPVLLWVGWRTYQAERKRMRVRL
ncbi:MAG: hypothetical protein MUD01_11840 [Chloroflexaceae bacterium]|nr:hypothetical protein [Chloroflexaceae bacterium]